VSAQVADPFAGHLRSDDPRSLMWASGGCSWPTVPAWNFLLASTNATGVLTFLNTSGIQLKPTPGPSSSYQTQWFLNGALPIIIGAVMLKLYVKTAEVYTFDLWVSTLVGSFFSVTQFPLQTCNRTHMLTPASLGSPVELGNTGDGFRLLQVEHDQTRPPGGWPP
jgi:hypothetical protein